MKVLFSMLLCTAVASSEGDKRFSWGTTLPEAKSFQSAPWVRDPFFPPLQGKFVLRGVISGELAFINNRWFREGDNVEGYILRQVTSDHVVLAKHSKVLIIKMQEGGRR